MSAVLNTDSAWSKGCNVPIVSCRLSQGEHLYTVYCGNFSCYRIIVLYIATSTTIKVAIIIQ